MTTPFEAQSDWCSSPGQTILDVLRARNLTPQDFATRMVTTPDEIQSLLVGTTALTTDLAERLSLVLGSTPQFWLNRERQYRNDSARLLRSKPSVDDSQWVHEFPIADMVRYGWIPRVTSIASKHEACLRFFDVKSAADFMKKTEVRTALRASPTFQSRPAAVAAWLRQGEIQAAKVDCAPWDAARFGALLPKLRGFTRKIQPGIFIPRLTEQCATCGVAVVIVRAPAGCAASGATRFPTPHKAVLMLSFRHLSDDQFWFTFFHESAHLVLHGLDSLFVEWERTHPSTEEDEANAFAANTLVPPDLRAAMLALPAQAMPVIKFAHQIGISPGLVVGQLQHAKRLRRDQLNFLKRRFTWE